MEINLDSPPKLKNLSEQAPISLGIKQYLSGLSVKLVWRIFLLVNISFALIYLFINLYISWQWINQPFVGFLHQNRVITHSDLSGFSPHHHEYSIGPAHVVEENDVIAAVDNKPLSSSQWLINYVLQKNLYDSISLSLNDIDNPAPKIVIVNQFTTQNFAQLVAIPAFIAFFGLVTGAAIVYLRSNKLQVRLFGLFVLALVYFQASFPEFIASKLFVFNFTLAFAGKIALPVFLLHFLLVFPQPRKVLKNWPFLLPLIYLPVLPSLIHIPILLIHPETTRTFSLIVESYTLLYTTIGLILLADVMVRSEEPQDRKQAAVLSVGIILPILLMVGLSWVNNTPIDYEQFYIILGHYGFIGVPIAVAIAVIRFELFDIQRTNRSHFFFMVVITTSLVGYFLLLTLISSISVNDDQFYSYDVAIILFTIVGFMLMRFLYHRSYQWWLDNHFYSTIEDFRIGLRISSRELLKVKSRRELESLISWEIASDFRLRSAELALTDKPTIPYALMLPLRVANVFLGTLFLGAKIDGKDFSDDELEILVELQKQMSLALWSLELDEAIQATEQLTRLKSKFLANVTHELRTPLNGIINYIGFALDDYRDDLNQEQIDYLERALQSSEKLLQIINNILDMSKIEVGQMTIHRQPTNLTDIVVESSPDIEEMLTNKPIEFITEISPALPNLYGDRLRLRQIVLNILSNAAKFTEAGKICLKAYPNNGNVIIQVSDTGIGIDEAILPTIFQHFVSAGLTDEGQYFGPGLSMPITKSLVELHGGQVDVESHPGQGTTFTVTLPVEPLEND